MYVIYILKSLNFPKTYVGMTNDVERRLMQHNRGESAFTSRYAPWEMIYIENCINLAEVRKREKYFKSGAGRRQIVKIIK